MWFLIDSKWQLVCCWGEIFLLFLKSRREIFIWKMPFLVKIRMIFLLPDGCVGGDQGDGHESFPFRASRLHFKWGFLKNSFSPQLCHFQNPIVVGSLLQPHLQDVFAQGFAACAQSGLNWGQWESYFCSVEGYHCSVWILDWPGLCRPEWTPADPHSPDL